MVFGREVGLFVGGVVVVRLVGGVRGVRRIRGVGVSRTTIGVVRPVSRTARWLPLLHLCLIDSLASRPWPNSLVSVRTKVILFLRRVARLPLSTCSRSTLPRRWCLGGSTLRLLC